MRLLFLVAVLFALPLDAHATSGFGCYRPNVGANDPLVILAEPSARSTNPGTVDSRSGEIISLDGLPRGEDLQPSLWDVHQAEYAVCLPNDRPLGARWCPVSVFGDIGQGDTGQVTGWIKRRFVDHSECP